MSDTALITETILDADGLDAEAFQRLYAEYIVTETIFGTVPMEVDDSDCELAVSIHDPSRIVRGGEVTTHRAPIDPEDLYGIPPVAGDLPWEEDGE